MGSICSPRLWAAWNVFYPERFCLWGVGSFVARHGPQFGRLVYVSYLVAVCAYMRGVLLYSMYVWHRACSSPRGCHSSGWRRCVGYGERECILRSDGLWEMQCSSPVALVAGC